MFEIGSKYYSRDTDRNKKNNILPGVECRIAHKDGSSISLHVFQNGMDDQFRVPRELFGVNFSEDRGGTPANKAYESPVPFKKTYE